MAMSSFAIILQLPSVQSVVPSFAQSSLRMMHYGVLGICKGRVDVHIQPGNDGCEILGEGDYAAERWRNWQA